MGLLDRFKDDQFKQLIADSEQQMAEQRNLARIEQQRLEIIKHKLVAVATDLGAKLTPVPGLPGYYQLSDLVLVVKPFRTPNGQLPDPGNPLEVTRGYCVSLVAIDDLQRIWYCRVGMLQMLDYDGLRRTVAQQPADRTFEATVILQCLHQPQG